MNANSRVLCLHIICTGLRGCFRGNVVLEKKKRYECAQSDIHEIAINVLNTYVLYYEHKERAWRERENALSKQRT